MHFAGNIGAAGGAQEVSREELGLWPHIVQVFANCQGVPYRDPVMIEARDQYRRGEQKEFCPHRRIVRWNEPFLEIEPREPRQQPTPLQPWRLILAGDGRCSSCHRCALQPGSVGFPPVCRQLPTRTQALCHAPFRRCPPRWCAYCTVATTRFSTVSGEEQAWMIYHAYEAYERMMAPLQWLAQEA